MPNRGFHYLSCSDPEWILAWQGLIDEFGFDRGPIDDPTWVYEGTFCRDGVWTHHFSHPRHPLTGGPLEAKVPASVDAES